MARTVNATPQYPARQAATGAEIVRNDSRDGGALILGQLHNTLYEQHRGALLVDSSVATDAPIITSTSHTAKYRCPVQGRGGLTETASVALYVADSGTGADSITVTQGANTAVWTASGGGAGWKATAAALTVDDTAEYVDVSITRAGTGTIPLLAASVIYERDATSLPALSAGYETYRSGASGFCPLDDAVFGSEWAFGPHQLYAMHEGARDIYTRPQPAISSSWPTNVLSNGDAILFRRPVPYGFYTLRLYLDGYYDGGGDVTVYHDREVSGETLTLPSSRDWTSALDIDVSDLKTVTVKIPLETASANLYGCSAYWTGRVLP